MEPLHEASKLAKPVYKIKDYLNNDFNVSEKDLNHHKIALAPMLDITNSYFRVFMRMLTKHTILYSEMIHENTILNYKHGYKELLKFFPVENPVVCQLGGNNAEKLAQCTKLCEEMGYTEVNLNVGCPSPRVQEGSFGACLMKEPDIVCKALSSMKNSVKIPVTIKCRLGVDEFDSYEFAKAFVEKVSVEGEVNHFVVHARKAFLKGLNPAENRNVPPLKYDWVLRLKKELPHLTFSINGGFKTVESIEEILRPENELHGCMIGRAAYESPWIFSDFDRVFFNRPNLGYSRREILEMWGDFGEYVLNDYNVLVSYPCMTKPIINLFNGEKFNTKYRQFLSDPKNHKAVSSYKEFIDNAIEYYDTLNKPALDQKPPTNSDSLTEKLEEKMVKEMEAAKEGMKELE